MDELRKRQKIISQLVEARLEQGISQAELARRLGIQRSGINRLESGTQNPTLDMILKIASALGKDVSLELNDKEEPMSNVYSLRIYDTELMRFSMEKQGLSGLVAEILYTNEEQAHLLPLDMERTGEGVIHWLERRVIPKNRAFVDEILKTLGLSHNDTKGIIDVCKGLSLNDSYWVVPEGFEGKFSQYNLYENRFSEILALVAYTGAGEPICPQDVPSNRRIVPSDCNGGSSRAPVVYGEEYVDRGGGRVVNPNSPPPAVGRAY